MSKNTESGPEDTPSSKIEEFLKKLINSETKLREHGSFRTIEQWIDELTEKEALEIIKILNPVLADQIKKRWREATPAGTESQKRPRTKMVSKPASVMTPSQNQEFTPKKRLLVTLTRNDEQTRGYIQALRDRHKDPVTGNGTENHGNPNNGIRAALDEIWRRLRGKYIQ